MKQILMSKLKPGNLFCYQFTLAGREAFLVKEIKPNGKILICSRTDDKHYVRGYTRLCFIIERNC